MPPKFASLRKLKSLNLYGCPLDDMPEIQDMGIDELFEYLNKLRGIGKYSFIWELPESFQTAFQQYINFFTDYVKKLKGYEVRLEVNKTSDGLRLETEATDDLSIEQISQYLIEYLEYAKENVEIKEVGEGENSRLGLLRIQLETQINHFKQQIRAIEFENKYLRNSVDKLLEAQVNFSHAYRKVNFSMPVKTIISNNNNKIENIRQLIVRNDFEKGFNDLSLLAKEKYPASLNEILSLYSRFNNVKIEGRLGIVNYEQKQLEINKIVLNLFEILDTFRLK